MQELKVCWDRRQITATEEYMLVKFQGMKSNTEGPPILFFFNCFLCPLNNHKYIFNYLYINPLFYAIPSSSSFSSPYINISLTWSIDLFLPLLQPELYALWPILVYQKYFNHTIHTSIVPKRCIYIVIEILQNNEILGGKERN